MIRLAIIGYGNLGKAAERIAAESDAFETVGIFTRRDPKSLTSPYGAAFFRQSDVFDMAGNIDVAAICTGSANDVTNFAPALARYVNTVDSFDTHAKMREYLADMDIAARESGHLSFVGMGWDPGLFSLFRALFEGALKEGYTQTFWGKGVSQGHGEAIRRIAGVKDAVQYTVPSREAMKLACEGGGATLSEREKHRRVCYVALEEGADKEDIEDKIKRMPAYFAPYETEVHFVSAETLKREHSGMPHGGTVLRRGHSNGKRCALDASVALDSNPDFTAAVLLNYAQACVRLHEDGVRGAKTILDVPISALFARGEDVVRFV